jgi:hypothetical protein
MSLQKICCEGRNWLGIGPSGSADPQSSTAGCSVAAFSNLVSGVSLCQHTKFVMINSNRHVCSGM